MDDFGNIAYLISVWVIPAVTAITLHEAAHGWVAWKLGDDTALRLGRVTFNPLRHIDNFGTILLPGMLILAGAPFLFGYAKPVPVNFGRLHHPRRDMIWVAAAGPGINIAMAFIAALLFHLVPLLPAGGPMEWVADNLRNAFLLNIVLAVFNMFPLPPLDGSRVVAGFLPVEQARAYLKFGRYGLLILLALLVLPPLIGGQLGLDLNILRWILLPPVEFVRDILIRAAGLSG
jgi:Zn-dependent protease